MTARSTRAAPMRAPNLRCRTHALRMIAFVSRAPRVGRSLRRRLDRPRHPRGARLQCHGRERQRGPTLTIASTIHATSAGRSPPTASRRRPSGPGDAAAPGVAHVCFLRMRSSGCRCRLDPGGSRLRPDASLIHASNRVRAGSALSPEQRQGSGFRFRRRLTWSGSEILGPFAGQERRWFVKAGADRSDLKGGCLLKPLLGVPSAT